MIISQKIGPVGFEPTTYGLEIRCSIQLSYDPVLQEAASDGTDRHRSRIHEMTQLALVGDGLQAKKRFSWGELGWRSLQGIRFEPVAEGSRSVRGELPGIFSIAAERGGRSGVRCCPRGEWTASAEPLVGPVMPDWRC